MKRTILIAVTLAALLLSLGCAGVGPRTPNNPEYFETLKPGYFDILKRPCQMQHSPVCHT